MTDLQEQVRALPSLPGVYLMKDPQGRVLYIGKAKCLKKRVSSYFQASREHAPKIQQMLTQVTRVDFLEAASEIEALLLESRLIKDIQPKYNSQLKDSKSYPYVGIARQECFPRVILAREHECKHEQFHSFGPFLDPAGLRRALKVLQRIFKFRSCHLNLGPQSHRARPCLLWSLEYCSGPCAGKITPAAYQLNIARLRRFLAGQRAKILAELQQAMQQAAAAWEFEKAAQLRDQIRALESLDKVGSYGDFIPGGLLHLDAGTALEELARELALDTLPHTIAGLDIAHFAGSESVGSLVLFVNGVPEKSGYRRYRIKSVKGVDDYGMMREVIRRRFGAQQDSQQPWPALLLLDGGRGQLHAVMDEFSKIGGPVPELVALAKKQEKLFRPGQRRALCLPKNSIALHLLCAVRDEAHRFAQAYHHLLRRKAVLNPDSPKQRD